jgi:hypothetical protein
MMGNSAFNVCAVAVLHEVAACRTITHDYSHLALQQLLH